jgi:hypothetical protein
MLRAAISRATTKTAMVPMDGLFTVPDDHGHDATHECGAAQIAIVNWQIG